MSIVASPKGKICIGVILEEKARTNISSWMPEEYEESEKYNVTGEHSASIEVNTFYNAKRATLKGQCMPIEKAYALGTTLKKILDNFEKSREIKEEMRDTILANVLTILNEAKIL